MGLSPILTSHKTLSQEGSEISGGGGSRISSEAHSQHDYAAFLTAGLALGVCSRQGKRPYQEDEPSVRAYLAPASLVGGRVSPSVPSAPTSKPPETHIFCLFDGHAGGRCSKYLSTALADVLAEDPSFYTNLPQALKRAFHTANEQFLKAAERLRLQDGSTGICVVLRAGKLMVANVGDCRAVLLSGGKVAQLSKDQKPTDPQEQKRIASLGGSVVYCMGVARVNGVLAVSRAFGNRSLRSVIRPDAELSSRDLQKDDDYLVIASDGLWDMLRNKDVCDIVYAQASRGEGPQQISDELVQAALSRGSMDNTTCIVVRLSGHVQQLIKGGSFAEETPTSYATRVESPTSMLGFGGVLGDLLTSVATSTRGMMGGGGSAAATLDEQQTSASKLASLRAFSYNSMRGSPLQTDEIMAQEELSLRPSNTRESGASLTGKPSFLGAGGLKSISGHAIPLPLTTQSKAAGGRGAAPNTTFRSLATVLPAGSARGEAPTSQTTSSRLLALQSPIQSVPLGKPW